MEYGIFPCCLKESIIHPKLKKGSSTDMLSYRPLANLSFFSKVLETVVKTRLVGYLEAFQILTPSQHGFTKGKSTESAIAEFLWAVDSSMDMGNPVVALMIDQSRAFDVLIPEILLDRMEKYGIRGRALSVFSTYLNGRTQTVTVQTTQYHRNSQFTAECKSLKKSVTIGTPQGSVLSCTLFYYT